MGENSEAVPANESRRSNLQRFEIRDDDEAQRVLVLHNNNNHHNNNYNNNHEEADKTTEEVTTQNLVFNQIFPELSRVSCCDGHCVVQLNFLLESLISITKFRKSFDAVSHTWLLVSDMTRRKLM